MNIVDTLREIVGADRVSSSDIVCLSYQHNATLIKGRTMKPDIVVLPETTEQVSQIVKAANKYKVPVTPKGVIGSSGLGGVFQGGILLDLSLMEKIISIDVTNQKVVVEAGCSYFKLAQELFKKGLMLPVPAYCNGPSVGASAITPANGFGKTKYGANIDLVEGFEVVLPSGEIARVGSMAYADSNFGPFYRYITGPDLVGLFTRSNGALGIVTKVAYQCMIKPRYWAFHSYYWPFEQIEAVTQAMLQATAFEVFDVHLNDKWRWIWEGQPAVPEDCYFALIFIVNAHNELELQGREQSIHEIGKTWGGKYLPGLSQYFHTEWPGVFFAGHPRQPRQAFKSKRSIEKHPCTYYFLGDLIYPTSKLPEVYLKTYELLKEYGIWDLPRVPVFDCYQMKHQVISSQTWIAISENDPYWVEQFHRCQSDFRKWYGEQGGLFQMRLPPLVPEYCWTNQLSDFNLLTSIKQMLDPNNILSPNSFKLGDKQ